MIFNLDNELSTIKAFLRHGASIVSMESVSESTWLNQFGQPSEEVTEEVITSPVGSNALEKIICRSVISELNSLCEFALQIAWIELSGSQLNLPNGSLISTAKRGDIEKFLSNSTYLGDKSTVVEQWPSWPQVKEIKELRRV